MRVLFDCGQRWLAETKCPSGWQPQTSVKHIDSEAWCFGTMDERVWVWQSYVTIVTLLLRLPDNIWHTIHTGSSTKCVCKQAKHNGHNTSVTHVLRKTMATAWLSYNRPLYHSFHVHFLHWGKNLPNRLRSVQRGQNAQVASVQMATTAVNVTE